MFRIAILGSCITRDLWPIRGGGAEQLHYICRTSFPSLLSTPIAGFRPVDHLPGDLHAHEHNALVADLQKTALSRLMAWRPTHIIFDFIDERFDLLAFGNSIATYSGELVRSGYLAEPALAERHLVRRLSTGCDRIWIDAVGEFAALIRGTPLSQARLILHSARWATAYRTAEGALSPFSGVEILGGDPVEIDDYNKLLERQEAAFLRVMPPTTIIDAAAFRLGDANHRWGLSPFHYAPEYYDEVRRQLEAAGLEGAFSDLVAEPSVPAA